MSLFNEDKNKSEDYEWLHPDKILDAKNNTLSLN